MLSFDFRGENTDVSVHIGETMVTESIEEKLLGVTLDKNLDFKSHVNAIFKKAGQKLYALARISIYMNVVWSGTDEADYSYIIHTTVK